jgi:predicted HTH domain antitoxin
MTANDTTRDKAMKLLGKGWITQSEAAELAGVSRQLVRHWCMRDGVDAAAARAMFLRRVWRAR